MSKWIDKKTTANPRCWRYLGSIKYQYSEDQSIHYINDSHGNQGQTIDVEEIIHEPSINMYVDKYVFSMEYIDVSPLSSENRMKYIANAKLIHDKLSDNEKHKEPNRSLILEEVYVGEITNSISLMETVNVEEAINIEVDGIVLPDWINLCFLKIKK